MLVGVDAIGTNLLRSTIAANVTPTLEAMAKESGTTVLQRFPYVGFDLDTHALVYYDVVRKGFFKKLWRRIKGVAKKVWKALPKVLGLAKKVTTAVAPVIPPPYGTVVAGISSGIGTAETALNLIGSVKSNATTLEAAFDASEDKFEVTPQYRVLTSAESAVMPYEGPEYDGSGPYNDGWISAEQMEVPVSSANTVARYVCHNLKDSPVYPQLMEYYKMRTGVAATAENPLYFQ